MKSRAPGKVMITGGYAVLEGAPALVMAVDRYAHADTARLARTPTAETAEALGASAPSFDRDELFLEGTKIGLGSSAAVLVASLGAVHALGGHDLEHPAVRRTIFDRAREAHLRVQGGGSGFDVAASTYGGVLRYSLESGLSQIMQTDLPWDLCFSVYFCGTSARTSDLVSGVAEFRRRDPGAYRRCMLALGRASERTAEHCPAGTVRSFITSARGFGKALENLGEASGCPIVPPAFQRLATVAEREGAAFLPSGAGGGDIGIYLGEAFPSERFSSVASQLRMRLVSVSIDRSGVCTIPN